MYRLNGIFGNSYSAIRKGGWGKVVQGAMPLFYEWKNSGPGSNTSQSIYMSTTNGVVSIEAVLGRDWKDWVE